MSADVLPFVLVSVYLEVIENTCTVHQHMTPIFKLPRLHSGTMFTKLDEPLSGLFLPETTDDFGVEVHILPQIECFTNFVQV